MTSEKNLKICEKGHKYNKTSDCPSCPICERENKPENGFLSKLSGPARGALIYEGIDTLEKLSKHTEKGILSIHGIGPASLPTMRALLKEVGLSFNEYGDRKDRD